MTYKELLEALQNLTEEQLDQDVFVYSKHEEGYSPADELEIAKNKDTDVDYPYISF